MISQIFRVFKCLVILSILMLTLGCNRPDPNPELKDPIYKDLKSEYSKYQKYVEDEQKKLDEAMLEMEKIEPRSLDRRAKTMEIRSFKKNILEYTQKAEYFRIKMELRRVYGRKAYRIAFQKGEDWPDPSEFKAYETNKRLQEAPRNWSHRVPKSTHQEIFEKKQTENKETKSN